MHTRYLGSMWVYDPKTNSKTWFDAPAVPPDYTVERMPTNPITHLPEPPKTTTTTPSSISHSRRREYTERHQPTPPTPIEQMETDIQTKASQPVQSLVNNYYTNQQMIDFKKAGVTKNQQGQWNSIIPGSVDTLKSMGYTVVEDQGMVTLTPPKKYQDEAEDIASMYYTQHPDVYKNIYETEYKEHITTPELKLEYGKKYGQFPSKYGGTVGWETFQQQNPTTELKVNEQGELTAVESETKQVQQIVKEYNESWRKNPIATTARFISSRIGFTFEQLNPSEAISYFQRGPLNDPANLQGQFKWEYGLSQKQGWEKWVAFQAPAYENVIIPLATGYGMGKAFGYIAKVGMEGSGIVSTSAKVFTGTTQGLTGFARTTARVFPYVMMTGAMIPVGIELGTSFATESLDKSIGRTGQTIMQFGLFGVGMYSAGKTAGNFFDTIEQGGAKTKAFIENRSPFMKDMSMQFKDFMGKNKYMGYVREPKLSTRMGIGDDIYSNVQPNKMIQPTVKTTLEPIVKNKPTIKKTSMKNKSLTPEILYLIEQKKISKAPGFTSRTQLPNEPISITLEQLRPSEGKSAMSWMMEKQAVKRGTLKDFSTKEVEELLTRNAYHEGLKSLSIERYEGMIEIVPRVKKVQYHMEQQKTAIDLNMETNPSEAMKTLSIEGYSSSNVKKMRSPLNKFVENEIASFPSGQEQEYMIRRQHMTKKHEPPKIGMRKQSSIGKRIDEQLYKTVGEWGGSPGEKKWKVITIQQLNQGKTGGYMGGERLGYGEPGGYRYGYGELQEPASALDLGQRLWEREQYDEERRQIQIPMVSLRQDQGLQQRSIQVTEQMHMPYAPLETITMKTIVPRTPRRTQPNTSFKEKIKPPWITTGEDIPDIFGKGKRKTRTRKTVSSLEMLRIPTLKNLLTGRI